MASLLERAGFNRDEIEARMVAAKTNERPSNPITKLMDSVRVACATCIAEQHSRFSGCVSLTEMSIANNFDILHGDEKRIRIVTERGVVAIMDEGQLRFMPGDTREPPKIAVLIVEYLIGGREAMHDKFHEEIDEESDNESDEEEEEDDLVNPPEPAPAPADTNADTNADADAVNKVPFRTLCDPGVVVDTTPTRESSDDDSEDGFAPSLNSFDHAVGIMGR